MKRKRTVYARNRYRQSKGIPLDAPLHTHGPNRKPRTPSARAGNVSRMVSMPPEVWKLIDKHIGKKGGTLGEAIQHLML